MRTVLVPVDGSLASHHAVERAAAMTKAHRDVKLLLLNVQQELDRRYAHGLGNPVAREHLKARGEEQAAAARAYLDDEGCCYEFMIAFGHPAEVIARTARERNCTDIIMGSHGWGRFGRAFFGSTGDAVEHECALPVAHVT